ncbi:hypothetical protein CWS33_29515, partial [Escherichia coli]
MVAPAARQGCQPFPERRARGAQHRKIKGLDECYRDCCGDPGGIRHDVLPAGDFFRMSTTTSFPTRPLGRSDMSI